MVERRQFYWTKFLPTVYFVRHIKDLVGNCLMFNDYFDICITQEDKIYSNFFSFLYKEEFQPLKDSLDVEIKLSDGGFESNHILNHVNNIDGHIPVSHSYCCYGLTLVQNQEHRH